MRENLRMSKKCSTFAAWYRTRMASAGDLCGCLTSWKSPEFKNKITILYDRQRQNYSCED